MVIVYVLSILLFIVGGLARFHAARIKPNHIYGYRSNNSMKNKKTWVEANRFSGQLLMLLSIFTVASMQIITNFITLSMETTLSIVAGIFILGIAIVVIMTESRLKKLFKLK